MGERSKVAVLGGGVGSIVAAFELTRTEELRERFDVTVYQLGWRLGGKGASGRDRERGDRILEHGLHVWFGFYDEAWRAMRAAYKELGRPPKAPLATLEKAFHACHQVVLYDRQGEEWCALPRDFPENDDRPGEPHPLPTFLDIGEVVMRWVRERFEPARREFTQAERVTAAMPEDVRREAEQIATPEDREQAVDDVDLVLRAAQRVLEDQAAERATGPERLLAWFLTEVRKAVWKVGEDAIRGDAQHRMMFAMFDVATSVVAGVVAEDLLAHDKGFDDINDYELCEWLAKHGAKDVTVGTDPVNRSPILRSIYDVAFGYVDGDIHNADVAAGTAINDLLRLTFAYRGAVFYKMNAGMGDVVFAPFYEVLSRRGVKFEFFNAVTNLRLSEDGGEIAGIDIVRQADVKDPRKEYYPLYPADVEGGKLPCWPSEPDWDQLEDAARGCDFEADPNPLGREARPLERGADFDAVVLGISLASLPEICQELIERHAPFAKAIETGKTVRTQAFQLWLNETSADLGWDHKPESVAGAYVEPLDTYCEMSHLIGMENVPGTKSIAYFCGVQDEREGEDQAAATARAKKDAVDFLTSDIGTLWPSAVEGDVTTPLRWDLLVDTSEAQGAQRFEAQYCRANITGSERYVLTPAGSVKYRLKPSGFGVRNLVLAGDWTSTGVDGGCVEAAAISGVRAAHALIGDEHQIPGEDLTWLRAR